MTDGPRGYILPNMFLQTFLANYISRNVCIFPLYSPVMESGPDSPQRYGTLDFAGIVGTGQHSAGEKMQSHGTSSNKDPFSLV